MDSKPELTIAKLVRGLPRLKQHEESLDAHEAAQPYTNEFPIVDKNTFLGIEIEVENVTRFDTSVYWMMTDDGSLRNHGKEFITHPIRAYRVERALMELEKALNKDIDFSERTSVHIHMNVRTLTIKQLINFIYTYVVFEEAFFHYADPTRFDSIFCCPLQESNLRTLISSLVINKNIPSDWDKYTALNLRPIIDKGTVEFRHMPGTLNRQKLLGWVNLILCLKRYALRQDTDNVLSRIMQLNTNSEYRIFTEEVFGIHAYTLDSQFLDAQLAKGVSYVKEFYTVNTFLQDVLNSIDPESKLRPFTAPEDAPISPIASTGRPNTIRIDPQSPWGFTRSTTITNLDEMLQNYQNIVGTASVLSATQERIRRTTTGTAERNNNAFTLSATVINPVNEF